MIVTIREISKIYSGFYQKPMEKGDMRYFQAKDFDDTGRWLGEAGSWLERKPQNEKHLLWEGDVLFVGKGYRNFAWAYKAAYGPAIASTIFMVLRPNRERIVPEYLAAVLNTEKYQEYFQKLGAGSSIPSIRKKELEAIDIPLPDLKEQEKVARFTHLQQERVALTHKITDLKNKQYQATLQKLIYS